MNIAFRVFCVVVICYLSIAFSGCSGGQTVPNEYYMIDAGRDAEVVESSHKSIKVLDMSVSRVFDSSNLIYKVSGNKFEKDYYHKYFAEVGNMASQSLIEWLSDSSLFDTVLSSRSLAETDYTLEGYVIELYGDFTNKKSPEAVVTIQFVLLDSLARGSGNLQEWRYSQRVAIANKSPEGLIDAYNTAFAQIFSCLEGDLIHAVAEGDPK